MKISINPRTQVNHVTTLGRTAHQHARVIVHGRLVHRAIRKETRRKLGQERVNTIDNLKGNKE